MTAHPRDRIVRLEAGELLDVHDGEGLRVICVNGAVWITQSHDPRDVVLSSGQSFVLDRPGLALVSAPGAAATVAIRATGRYRRPAAAKDRAWPMRSAA
jgi:hypothetical protein